MPRALFDLTPRLPDGMIYRPDVVSGDEERALIAKIERLELRPVVMRGVESRRRVAQFGYHYDVSSTALTETRPIPAFLLPVRARVAELAKASADEFSEALIMEYPAAATIGWHCDAPHFGIVAGVSLAASCTFRFRRGDGPGASRVSLVLEPRSAYVLDGPARTEWQHSIPPTACRRLSLTFRTLRRRLL